MLPSAPSPAFNALPFLLHEPNMFSCGHWHKMPIRHVSPGQCTSWQENLAFPMGQQVCLFLSMSSSGLQLRPKMAEKCHFSMQPHPHAHVHQQTSHLVPFNIGNALHESGGEWCIHLGVFKFQPHLEFRLLQIPDYIHGPEVFFFSEISGAHGSPQPGLHPEA